MFPIATGKADISLSMASDGTNYLVGIQGDYAGPGLSYYITAQMFGPAGALIGPRINPVPGHTTGGYPFTACSGANYLMVWPDNYLAGNYGSISGQLISPSGGLIGGMIAITTSSQQGGCSVAFGGGQYLVVYDDHSNGANWAVYGQLVSSAGALVGSSFVISAPLDGQDEKGASVAFDGNNFLVVWQLNSTSGGNHNVTYGVFVSPSGTMGTPFAIGQTVSLDRNPLALVFNGTDYLVVWNIDFQLSVWNIYGRFVTPSGAFPGNEFAIVTKGYPIFPHLAFDGANYLLNWTQGDFFTSINTTVQFQFLNSGGQPTGPQFTPFTPQGSEVPLFAPLLYDGKRFVSAATLSANGLRATNHASIYGAFIAATTAAQGSLQVTLEPAGAVSAGAEWQVDSGATQKSGATLTNLTAGSHTVSFTTIAGWNTPANQTVTIANGATTQAGGVYTQAVTGNPKLSIASPKSGQSVSNALLVIAGTVTDKVSVDAVYYQLNGGGWMPATPSHSWSNWTASVTPTPGPNTLQAYALDATGKLSLTNTVKFTYVLYAPLTVQWTGQGTVNPDYGGKLLQVGKSYTMTATPARGFAFTGWTGSQPATTARLTFQMNSNLAFTANFADVQRPVLAILSPKANQKVSAAALSVSGKAGDNVGVVSVLYQLNGAGWNLATTANAWTNWTAAVTLASGLNTIQAYAVDAAGNASLTNTVKCTYGTGGAGDLAPSSVSGLSAVVAPAGLSRSTLTFGDATFTAGDEIGTYTYAKLSPNTAQLLLTVTAPPSRVANSGGVVALTFTKSNEATFVLGQDGTVLTGTAAFSQARSTAPDSMAGHTLHALANDGPITVAFGNGTMTETESSGTVGTGSYTYNQYSPVGGILVITYTRPADQAGSVYYIVLTFSSAGGGSYYLEAYDASGTEEGNFSDTFTVR